MIDDNGISIQQLTDTKYLSTYINNHVLNDQYFTFGQNAPQLDIKNLK